MRGLSWPRLNRQDWIARDWTGLEPIIDQFLIWPILDGKIDFVFRHMSKCHFVHERREYWAKLHISWVKFTQDEFRYVSKWLYRCVIEYYLTQNSNLDQFVTFYNKSEVIALLLHTWIFFGIHSSFTPTNQPGRALSTLFLGKS